MGAIPAKLPGGYDLGDDDARARYERAWGATLSPKPGMHLSEMFEAMEAGTLRSLYCIGRTRPSPRPTPRTHGTCWKGSTTSSCRTSSAPRRPSSPTSCCRRPPTGASTRAPSPAASAASSACARRSTHPGSRVRTRTSSAPSPTGSATRGVSRPPSRCGTSCGRCRSTGTTACPTAVGGARRAAVAVPRRGPSRHAAAARPVVGARPGRARARRAVHARWSTCRRSTR